MKKLRVLVSAISKCISISVFASIGSIPVVMASSAEGLKICTITSGIK